MATLLALLGLGVWIWSHEFMHGYEVFGGHWRLWSGMAMGTLAMLAIGVAIGLALFT
jgi:hypothetical protein